MHIVSIEPTPSPHSMKINLDESLPQGIRSTYTEQQKERAPEWVRLLLDIPGVKSIFHTADFIALERFPQADWKQVLQAAAQVLGGSRDNRGFPGWTEDSLAFWGELRVYVQTLRGIPMQVKIVRGLDEARFALSPRFTEAAMQASAGSPFVLKERKWEENSVRYGDVQAVGDEVVQELEAAYNQPRLDTLAELAARPDYGQRAASAEEKPLSPEELQRMLSDPNWRTRYSALQRLKPSSDTLPLVRQAMVDENGSIRRLAVVYLGDIGTDDVLPDLYRALQDNSIAVRRTAGDVLSDLGNPQAVQAMIRALKDSSKLVRWRAARFLYEVGDASALQALKEAENDEEFEIGLQASLAVKRIEAGEEAGGTVWQQMMQRSRDS